MTLAADPKKKTITRAFTVAELSKLFTAAVQSLQDGPGTGHRAGNVAGQVRLGRDQGQAAPLRDRPPAPASRRQALAARPTAAAPAGDDGPATISMTTELRDFGDGLPRSLRLARPAEREDELREARRPPARVDDFDRHLFDAGLNRLRDADEFGLDSHEGLHGTLTPEEREAGMREAGSLLVYVSRR